MTPARYKALQWFYDRGGRGGLWAQSIPRIIISTVDVQGMINDGELNLEVIEGDQHLSLTDKGRQALHGDDV